MGEIGLDVMTIIIQSSVITSTGKPSHHHLLKGYDILPTYLGTDIKIGKAQRGSIRDLKVYSPRRSRQELLTGGILYKKTFPHVHQTNRLLRAYFTDIFTHCTHNFDATLSNALPLLSVYPFDTRTGDLV
jgi:hypothetical protein